MELAGATLVEPTQQQLDRIAAGDTAVDGIDIAIADPDRSKWGLELTKRQEVPQKSRQGGSFSVVSVEWLTQSLVAGVQLQLAESSLFSPESKVEDMYFISRAKTAPVRYTIDDIVQYNTEDQPCLGRIVSFTHKGKLAKVLHITERPCSLVLEPQTSSSGAELEHKELEVCAEGRCTIIAANKLLHKVLVLPREEYAKLRYTGKENHIYCASVQWEEQEADREEKYEKQYLRAAQDEEQGGEDDDDHNFAMTQGDW